MPESLGEKLREARTEQGITISEVAEQTRISALYLEAIENDDYRTLPGGIFNKGFVKSFAKYVGVDEHEALEDYARIISSQEGSENPDELKTYRPEVLTDDRSGGSMLPTIIIAVIILGLLTWGILALVNYLQNAESPIANNNATNSNANVSENANVNTNVNANQSDALPSTDEIKVELKAVNDDVSVTSNVDGKTSSSLIKTDTSLELQADNSLSLKYAKSRAMYLEMTLNGKKIKVPQQSKVSNANIIDFEINKANIKNILRSGEINFDTPTEINKNTTANVP